MVFKCITLECKCMVSKAHTDGKLVHDTAVDTDKLVFCPLRKFYHLHHLKSALVKEFVEHNRSYHLYRCRGRQTCTIGNITAINKIKTFDFNAQFGKLMHHPQRVINPCSPWLLLTQGCTCNISFQLHIRACKTHPASIVLTRK